MKIIIKFSPEIAIKSRSVRIFFVKILVNNIRIVIKKINQSILVVRYWDYLEIQCISDHQLVCMSLIYIPGIYQILLVEKYIFKFFQEIYEKVFLLNHKKLSGKMFCVRVKRYGNHNFTSQDVERYLGKRLCDNVSNIRVNLSTPDKIIYLEIKNNLFFIIIKRYQGLGGLPIGTQHQLLSLISGGFDSSVSSYMLIKRGCKVHYCFFDLVDNFSHTIEICKIVFYLWNKFGSSHNVKFIVINFSHVMQEILVKIKNNQMSVILKRMMIRVASLVASRWKIPALITGEVLGQVSSQTLSNLILINDISNHMILRPLISYDKETIINLARNIGTEIFSKNVMEYCAIISKKPTTKAIKSLIENEENKFDFSMLEKSVSTAYVVNVQDIPRLIMNRHVFNIKIKNIPDLVNDVILDIRTEEEKNSSPLNCLFNVKVKHIPFYKLINCFSQLDQNKTYLLYCNNGFMSRLQAISLFEKGFYNVKLYYPS